MLAGLSSYPGRTAGPAWLSPDPSCGALVPCQFLAAPPPALLHTLPPALCPCPLPSRAFPDLSSDRSPDGQATSFPLQPLDGW